MSEAPKPENRVAAQGREVRRVTLTGLVANVGLAAVQLVSGALTGSRALIADGVHTLSDLVSDGVVLLASRLAAAPPDEDHPYGHGKYEPLATIILSALLAVTGAGIAVSGYEAFSSPSAPSSAAALFALLGLVVKESLYHYTVRAGRRLRSELLRANAWHHRSDALSSAVSFGGVVGALSGYPILDPVASVIVACIIGWMALRMGYQSIQQLLDAALEEDLKADIREAALELDGVISVHALRARRMGPYVLVDLHIDVPGSMTVLEAHGIAERAESRIRERFREVSEVLIHLDPAEKADPDRSPTS